MNAEDIVGLLRSMERRGRERSRGLPQQEEERELWQGVVFFVSDARLVADLNEIGEILNYPTNLTRVPGAQSWMLGIANIRGTLLPIVDLGGFLHGTPTTLGRRSRVLVFRRGTDQFGLLVGEMVGMRYFDQAERAPRSGEGGGASRFSLFGFSHEGAYWPVFSMQALGESSDFQSAAV